MFKSPSDKRAKSLARITRNAAINCAVFDEENPLDVIAIYEVPVAMLLREAERQLDASRNEISHVGSRRVNCCSPRSGTTFFNPTSPSA